MLLRALDRKLLREVTRLKGQVITIALVLASGITSFIALRGTFASLIRARDAYYDGSRFGDVFASCERAPETLGRRLEAIPGVTLVQTRIAKPVTVPIEGMSRPAYGRLLSLPPSGVPDVNALTLRAGRYPERGRSDEVVLLDAFAKAHGLVPGHRVPVVMGGKLRQLRVVGLALSPEYIYAVRPGALSDDPQRYAVLWMERSTLGAAFSLDGAFNEVALRLQPGAPAAPVLAEVDRLLARYGGDGAVAREDQPSNKILTGELGQLEALAGMVPLVFLGVSAFLMNLVLSRLVALQRPEIATLKAIGYSDSELARHFLGLVGVVLLPGALLGVAGGWALGIKLVELYASVFRFPSLTFVSTGSLAVAAVLISLLAAVAGALLAVRQAVRMPPAEAMQPPAPGNYRRGLLDRLGLYRLAGPSGAMVLREVARRPLRTLLSSAGIAGAVALVILGRFGLDSLERYLEETLRREQRQELAVSFVKPQPPRVVGALARLPGVSAAEGLREVPVRARHLNHARDCLLLGLPPGSDLRRLIEVDGRALAVPEGGVLLSAKLAEVLGLGVGDRVELELREGERDRVRPVVLGLVRDTIGLQVYALAGEVAALEGDRGATSSVLLSVLPGAAASVEAHLRRSPNVIDVSDLPADIERMRDLQASMMDVWTAISITLGACVIFGVVYNNARIALAMRSRDLASLRVLGFSRGEISGILIGGLAVEVALALPVGLWLGARWGEVFLSSVDREVFRWEVFIAPQTNLMAVVVALCASAASALWVRRSLDRLDLVSVLKTRE